MDPDEAIRKIVEAQKNAPQVDRYSSSAEVAIRNESIKTALQSQGVMAFELSDWRYSFKYDADAQVMRLDKIAESFLVDSDLYNKKLDKLTIASLSKKGGSYSASSSFGVKVRVKTAETKEISLAIPRQQGFQPSSIADPARAPFMNSRYSLSFPLDRSTARAVGDKWQVVGFFRPEEPFLYQYGQHIAPEVSSPYEVTISGRAIFGRLLKIWIVNPESREIVGKF